tara:strand:+ start:347 stop:610 length:264 start_codon:yes stop_codon:yes gene_type:complete
MKKIIFPTNPYEGQIYWDMKTKIIFEYWEPEEGLPPEVKPKWIALDFQKECVENLFSQKGKNKYFAYNRLIDRFGWTDEQIKNLLNA